MPSRKEPLCVVCGACPCSAWRSLPPWSCPCRRLLPPVRLCPRRRNGCLPWRSARCHRIPVRRDHVTICRLPPRSRLPLSLCGDTRTATAAVQWHRSSPGWVCSHTIGPPPRTATRAVRQPSAPSVPPSPEPIRPTARGSRYCRTAVARLLRASWAHSDSPAAGFAFTTGRLRTHGWPNGWNFEKMCGFLL